MILWLNLYLLTPFLGLIVIPLYPFVMLEKDKPLFRFISFLFHGLVHLSWNLYSCEQKLTGFDFFSISTSSRFLQEKVNLHKTGRFIFICRAIHHLPLLLLTRKLTRPENNNPHHCWALHFFVVSRCSINQFHSFRAWVVIIFTIPSSLGINKESNRNSGITGSLEPEGFSNYIPLVLH